MPDERNVLIVITVPASWRSLSVREITRKLRRQPQLIPELALQIKRWANRSEVDVPGLRRVVEDLERDQAGGGS